LRLETERGIKPRRNYLECNPAAAAGPEGLSVSSRSDWPGGPPARREQRCIISNGVKIPVCGLSTLIETKKGIRPEVKEDLLFLIGKKDYLEK
jgi:hypothetical protein